LPDPHAYIRTPTYKQPETEYEAIREKSANQKRDIEKALTKFLAKTAKGMRFYYYYVAIPYYMDSSISETHNLFDNEEVQMFPLIASKPTSVPAYITALNPSDQIFDFEELEYYYLVANRKPDDEVESDVEEKREDQESQSPPKKRKNKKSGDFKKEPDSVATTRPPTPVEIIKPPPPPPEPQEKVIDNPFLKLKKPTA